MTKKLCLGTLSALLLLAMQVTSPTSTFAGNMDPQMTGLPELTQEELEWQNKHHKRVKKVKLNKIGLKRINEKRKQKGRRALSVEDIEIVPKGTEIEAAPGAEPDSANGTVPSADLPGKVDNSQLKYFPPIRSQGSLPTCGSFSGTYYAMTYMWAMANDLDAKNGGDDFRLSPKWNNNMVNGGTNSGSWYYWCYDIGMKHGTASWAEFPYDNNYREWCLVPSTWYDSIYRRFDTYGYVNNTDTDTGIEQVKQLLLNGYVLNFPTYINSWQWTTIKNDPSTADDDATVGKSVAFWVNGTAGYHAMTVVGYDDTIWTDVNGNGVVDNGEKGAFRIANSWGTGWKEGGFCWMAYDALKGSSAVSGAPSAGRIDGWSPARAHWVTARSFYTPQVVAEFTLKHAKRNQLRVTLGLSDTSHTQPSSTWYPQMIAFDGGAYAFDGTTTPIDGTFVFDFTDLVAASNGQRWHLGLYDNASGNPVDLFSYTLIDVANGELPVDSEYVPLANDAGQLYTAIDYDADSTNQAPTADVSAAPVSGDASLTVSFDAGGSSDADGSIVSYHWNFGDGAVGSGNNVNHTYQAGQFTATLTVTDDAGATDTASVVISVNEAANQAPTVHVSANPISGVAQLNVTFSGSGSSDPDGTIVSYQWNFGDGASGNGATASHTYTSAGQFTAILTVTDNDGAADTASVVISVNEAANQAPMAHVSANPISGTAQLNVTFSGSGSSDPDGAISNYSWSFGDGFGANGMVVDHTYQAGQYTAVLTVTDNDGAADSASVAITVATAANLAPTADISAVPVNSASLLTMSFDASGSSDPDGSIVNYDWNFGDGNSGSGMTVSHEYTTAGQYTALLTVTDNDGATDTDAVVITVEDPSALNAPYGLNAIVSGKTVTLSWSHAGVNEDGFYIERAAKIRGQYNFKRVATVGPNVTGYADTVAKGSYQYRVTAFQAGTVSGYSNEVEVRIK